MDNSNLGIINKPAKGKRPNFFADKSQEHLMSMTLALMQELAVTRERLDTVERLLEAKGVMTQNEVDTYIPTDEAAVQRQDKQHSLISTVMRSLEQEVNAMKQ